MLFFPFLIAISFAEFSLAISLNEITILQPTLNGKTTGERIAYWAEKFIGTSYDQDPQGIYVTQATIVADEKVDCMYLTFRAVELALSHSPEEAIQIALDKRFHSRGILRDGRVMNYEDRFQYGEDMIRSNKWGKEITSEIGRTMQVKGTRGKDVCEILSSKEILRGIKNIQTGDILFFITPPEKRKVGECVGHIGIVKIENSPETGAYLIHASGTKNRGGKVKKVLLKDYVSKMPFMGGKVTRFE